jgi:hypothetical protein
MNRGRETLEPELAPAAEIPEHQLLQPIASGAYGEVVFQGNARAAGSSVFQYDAATAY